MTKRYLLYKCNGRDRLPLVYFTAEGANEAKEAPTWLKRKHPDRTDLVLGPGEFFEVIEQGQCAPEEWDKAMAVLGAPDPIRRG